MVTINKPLYDYSNNIHQKVAIDQGEVKYEQYKVVGAAVKPGRPVSIITALGESGCIAPTANATGDLLVYGIAEFMPELINDCSTGYTAGDVINIIPFNRNRGLMCRNLSGADPGKAIDKNTPFTVGASGFALIALKNTTGAWVPTRTLVRAYRYTADPDAAFLFVGVIE